MWNEPPANWCMKVDSKTKWTPIMDSFNWPLSAGFPMGETGLFPLMMSASLADEMNLMNTFHGLLGERNALSDLDGEAMHKSSPLKYWSNDFLPVLWSVLVEALGKPVFVDILLHPGNTMANVGSKVY